METEMVKANGADLSLAEPDDCDDSDRKEEWQTHP